MSDVLAALPPLAPGVRFYDRILKERGDDGKMRPVDGPVRMLQLWNQAAPDPHRLATLIVPPECPDSVEEQAQKLIEYCGPYGYFAQ